MRKKGEAVYDEKYQGKLTSRNELYGDTFDEEMQLSPEEPSAFPPSDDDHDHDDITSIDEEEEALPSPPPTKSKKSSRSSTTTNKTTAKEAELAMMKQMKSAANADVEKGRDVKKQLVRTNHSFTSFIMKPSWDVEDQDSEGCYRC